MTKTDAKKLDKFGVFIENSGSEITVHCGQNLSSLTRRELHYIFGHNVNFTERSDKNHVAYIRQRQDTGEIMAELEGYVTDDDFEKSAEIALSASSELDAPVVKLLNNLLAVAISRVASDLHIDTSDGVLDIRMRFDGLLINYAKLDIRIAAMLMSRIKLLSGMDITEKRRPQDGRFSVWHGGRNVDIRAASIPVRSGERIALRLFNREASKFILNDTGLASLHVDALQKSMSRQNGLILICGPTGSGKTSTIYSMLNSLSGRGLNIMTIEDPVEVELKEIVQTQVNEANGFGFADGLRSILRNDPDVILVGEIRDEKTAEIAVRASMTGHLVISTVHSNSNIGAIKRLMSLGVDKSLLSDCLIGVFTQRLVRSYCSNCKDFSIKAPSHKSMLPSAFDGCESCFYTGFSARVPVMSHILLSNEDRVALDGNLISKLKTTDMMVEEAMSLHEAGLTPLFEVNKLKSE